MAVVANTYRTTSAVGNREELADEVNMLDPQDTPIYTMIGKPRCKSVHPEWETIGLDTPAANAIEEGAEYTYDSLSSADRVGNYTQIFRKTGRMSGTQNAVDNAGKAEQLAEAKMRKGIALRKDVEFAIVSNTASVAGATRYAGSLPSWIETNVSRGSGGSNGGFSSGTGLTVAATNGTQRAFSKAITDAVAEDGYTSGANFRYLVTSPYVKSVFVTFMSDSNVASFRYAASGGKNNTIVANADIYEGPFGKLNVVPNRVMATSAAVARNAFFIDPQYLAWAWLKGRAIKEDTEIAKTGDAEQFVLLGEGTLVVKNEKGLGVAADLYGLTSGS